MASQWKESPGYPKSYAHQMTGLCWWCGHPAETGEHIFKKSDIKKHMMPNKTTDESGISMISREDGAIREIQGPNSKHLKFRKSMCARCNNQKSQPFDNSYDLFIEYALTVARTERCSTTIRFSDIFGSSWTKQRDNLIRYFMKHIGCRLHDNGIRVPKKMVEYMNGDSINPDGVQFLFGNRLDLAAYLDHMEAVHNYSRVNFFTGDPVVLTRKKPEPGCRIRSHLTSESFCVEYLVDLDGNLEASGIKGDSIEIEAGYIQNPEGMMNDCGICLSESKKN
ncbi:hypothetical protein [Nocardiopsis dassonvillei]|uniref:hypothetical protein n=1 Tax=Nocardiopsis dassonvillei TaxID=2014 RepID=UPI00157D1449|nr:hypothetical protein [Nocardiopsis dassonvillei]